MRQIALDTGTGQVVLKSVSYPVLYPGWVLVRSIRSIISTGTEVSKIDLASKSLWGKAQARPSQVAQVIESVRSDGLLATARRVQQRLAIPQLLGYSLSGAVVEVGAHGGPHQVGAPVACGGATACHAEVVAVPQNLAATVPAGVPLDDACFATVASIALHGLRTGKVALGDRVLVIGLGLIGQLAVRLCVTAGAHVFGVDPRRDRCDLAISAGAEAADERLDKSTALQVVDWSAGRGADVVLITAGGADNQPLILAGAAARDRARVVVVGVVDLDVPREPFYEKELSLIVSRSYGPGRYDPAFEDKGLTYPVGFVPWTERRNMEEVLNLLADGRLSLDGLRGTTFPFERAPEAYELLAGKHGPSPIAVVLEYGGSEGAAHAPEAFAVAEVAAQPPPPEACSFEPRPLNISFLGMGNFASSYLLPNVKSAEGAVLEHVVTASPLKAETARRRAGFRVAGTVAEAAIADPETHVIFIATRHDSHARYAEAALKAGKAIFVEKPLALNADELDRVAVALRATQGRLMIGFNRRFAPATRWALDAIGANRIGLRMLCRVNAGALPPHHWLLDLDAGGGRLLGEACHFIDLVCFLARAEPTEVRARALDAGTREGGSQDFSIALAFATGASAEVLYISSGSSTLPKEHIEIHRSGTSVVIDDFRRVALHRSGRPRVKKWGSRDKGHRAEVRAFLDAVRTGAPTPIPEEESLRSTALTLAAARSIREGRPLRRGEW